MQWILLQILGVGILRLIFYCQIYHTLSLSQIIIIRKNKCTGPYGNITFQTHAFICYGWCPCSDCASFSLDSIPRLQDQGSLSTSMETCKKGLKRKQTEDLKGKATDRSTDIIEDVFASDIDKMEMDAEKENVCDRFSFDTTVDELEKLMEGECPANCNTAKNNEWAYNNFESWRSYSEK